jgi:ppGpp synthetase/RelA/SpoT-type nucleotidyltranferase
MLVEMPDGEKPFDFGAHGEAAESAYFKRRDFYEDLSGVVKSIVEESLKRRGIKVHSVQARAKDPAGVARKAALPSETDPMRPKYAQPLEQITDLAGVRVITYFPSTLTEIDEVLSTEFRVAERSDKGAMLIEEDRFGYQSIHYLVRLTPQRSRLPEYKRFADVITEIQVRTILQHAWAEIEHDIQYKSASVIPHQIRRRFTALAGMFELADREFQAIQDADRQITEQARSSVQEGHLAEVEITPDALKAFLDQRLGSDLRISPYSYNWTARLLKKLGFRTLDQVDKCIQGYDDDQLSRIAAMGRMGQTTRFEYMLLAGMGENYIRRHLWAGEPWYGEGEKGRLERFRSLGINVRAYDPTTEKTETETEPSLRSAI